ncbi:MAG TPA: hypothetical protein VFS24_10420 [Steroidobacteraceae bacterium]|jgi:hypothetical protein|nr:hypothetical protein [Steroidobacteraceae bacterium]
MSTHSHSHPHEHATVAVHRPDDQHAHEKPVNPLSMINVVFALMFLLLAALLAGS